ncbi:MAG: metallopeptidase TldD-related protein [Clostridia bacterium]|nr:metallopeptidase TldD-related protein [Clostridia bacterium]
MINRIIKALNAEKAKIWQINRTETERAELYFIGGRLDIPRRAFITEYKVTVYRDFEEDGKKFRGSSCCFIEDGLTDDEIAEKIRSAYYAAQFVRNPFYELPSPVTGSKDDSDSDLCGRNLSDIAEAFAKAVLSIPTDGNAFVNSLEIFVTRKKNEVAASTGTHVSFIENRVSGEYVTQCKRPVDVEQYRLFDYNSFDTEALKKSVRAAIRDAELRAAASASPKKGTYNILLTGENLKTFFEYYAIRGNASVIAPGYSTWKKGDTVQKSGSGELLNIDLVATEPYSSDGIPMKDTAIIREGRFMQVTGPTRFMRYLGEEPSGTFSKLRVSGGTRKFEDMKKEGTLETVSFSDFQMDFFTGNFGGEMRLAILHADGKEIPLTGGSVNGKISAVEDKLVFSEERYEDSEYSGPYALLIPDVPVAGE